MSLPGPRGRVILWVLNFTGTRSNTPPTIVPPTGQIHTRIGYSVSILGYPRFGNVELCVQPARDRSVFFK